jgi:ComF family protein
LIERGKFGTHPNPQIFYYLGRLAAQEYIDSDLFDDVDCLVPVPLHPRRLRERGFNQAEYICKGMSEVLHIPVDNQHLIRTRNNPHQSRSQFVQRKDNVKELFSMRYLEEWKNKHILLVDDVVTSGATMFECMKQLSPIRGCRVSAFALGWAHS